MPAVENFLANVRLRGSEHTVSAYESDLQQFQEFMGKLAENATSRDIESWLLSLSKQKRSTLSRKRACLRSFYKYTRRQGIRPDNPADDIDTFRIPKRRPNFLTIHEIRHIRRMSPSPIFEFLISSGVRESELCSLTWDKVNMEKRVARVIGKGNKEREVLFSVLAAESMGNGISGPVFLTSRGRPYNEFKVWYEIQKLGTLIGRRVYPHLLRHTFATHLLEAGAQITEVQALLGHEDIATTGVYVHPTTSIREHYDKAIESLT